MDLPMTIDNNHEDERGPPSRSAIYNLLLDSQLELKSDGGKITCSKTAKKRKRGSNIPVTDVATKCVYVSAYESAVNSGEEEPIRKYLQQYGQPNVVLHLDLAALNPTSPVPLFREFRGVESIVSYLSTNLLATPDSISIFWQKGIRKSDDGGREIDTDCHFIGRRMFDIEIIKDESFDAEQMQLETAISGLTALASKHPADDASLSSGESEPSLPNVSLDTLRMVVAGGDVRFRKGKKLATGYDINHKGSFTFYLDADKKISRFKFLLIQ